MSALGGGRKFPAPRESRAKRGIALLARKSALGSDRELRRRFWQAPRRKADLNRERRHRALVKVRVGKRKENRDVTNRHRTL